MRARDAVEEQRDICTVERIEASGGNAAACRRGDLSGVRSRLRPGWNLLLTVTF